MRAAKDQYLNQLLEDHVIGYAGPMAAEWMVYFPFRQQGHKLFPDGLLLMYAEMAGMGARSFDSGSFENSLNDRASCARLTSGALRPYWRSL